MTHRKSTIMFAGLLAILCTSQLFTATAYADCISLNLYPQQLGGQWSIDGGITWLNSGDDACGPEDESFTVTFKEVSGWIAPDSFNSTFNNSIHYSTQFYTQPSYFNFFLGPQEARDAGAQWSIDGGITWHNSGEQVGGIDGQYYTVICKELAGWDAPQPLTITPGMVYSTQFYTQTADLTVALSPPSAVNDGAQWSVDDGNTWYNSGDTFKGIDNQQYAVVFKDLSGWTEPDADTVTLSNEVTSTISAQYSGDGGLKILLAPLQAIDAGAQWSPDAGATWYNDGETFFGGAGQTYTITFKDLTDWSVPIPFEVQLGDGETITSVASYTPGNCSLKVFLSPQRAIDSGAMWSIDGGNSWNESGTTIDYLGSGTKTITYKSNVGWSEPVEFDIEVLSDHTVEYHAESYLCIYDLIGDLNSDCIIDFADLAILAQNWMTDCLVTPDDISCQ